MNPRGVASTLALIVAASSSASCGSDTRSNDTMESQTSAPTSASASGGSSGGDKLDVGDSGTDPTAGCDKVDFLFVVDNSESMLDEQASLVSSFDGFISTISQTLLASDYHIMVVDTDAEALNFGTINCSNDSCSCDPSPQCCFAVCSNMLAIPLDPPPSSCGGTSCAEYPLPTGCPVTLGAGKAEDLLGDDCGIAGGLRYMTQTQPNLTDTFGCAALVGAGGDGNERPIDAALQALGPQSNAGGCQEGFLRDDAVLVVTIITDEDDDGSDGSASDWVDALLALKGGRQDAVVVLSLLGDSDVDGGTCTEDQALGAPNLRSFTEAFDRGLWGSVCAPTYNAFFDEAVGLIDLTCDEFVPAG
jgi:hypothetical protein